MHRRAFVWSVVVCALGVASASAQDHPSSSGSAATSAVTETRPDGGTTGSAVAPQGHPDAANPVTEVDVSDLWRLIRHRSMSHEDDIEPGRRYLVFAPSIGSKPTTGFTGGLSGNVAFIAGDAATTHISTFSGGMKVSQKGQTLSGSRLAVFTKDDQWYILSDNRMSWTSMDTFALGADAAPSTGTNLKVDVLRLYESVYRKVKPGLFVGGGINVSSHFNVLPGPSTSLSQWSESAYVAYNDAHGFSSTHQDSSGVNVGLRYDTRDNAINPDGGWLASATYRAFVDNFLGGDSTWQELALDARTYVRLTPDARQKLAFWFLGDLVTGGTAPFWDLPEMSADGRSARGYGEGRYRGEQLLYWEAEYRATLTSNGLIGMVLFANATTIGNSETNDRLFRSWAPAAGFGLRVLLNKRSRTNLCADLGWGKQDSHGFYLGIQEAF